MPESISHTSDEAGQADTRAAHVVAEILKAAHRLRSTLSTHFSEFGLTDVRFAVMKIIRDSAPDGCTQSRLAAELDQSESSISTLVERMRSSQLLYRLRSKLDRRKRVLMLTERSRNLLEAAERCHDERVASLLSCFDAQQLEQFSSLLHQLQDILTAETTPLDSLQSNITPMGVALFNSESEKESFPQEHSNPAA